MHYDIYTITNAIQDFRTYVFRYSYDLNRYVYSNILTIDVIKVQYIYINVSDMLNIIPYTCTL